MFRCLWEVYVIRLGHFQLLRSNFGVAVHSRFEVLQVFAVVAGFGCSPCSILVTGNRPVSHNEVSNAARRMGSGISGQPSRCRVASLSGNSITPDIVMQVCSGLSSGLNDRGHYAKNRSEFSGCTGRGEHNEAESQHRINGESWVPPPTLASSLVDTEFAAVLPRGFLPFLP